MWTDHNPLAHLKSARAGATEMRWMAQLAPYDIEIRYQPGGINECADALSRRPDMPGNNMLVREVTSYVALSREPILVQQVTGTVNPLTPEEVKPRPSVVPSFTPSELQDLQKEDPALSKVSDMYKNHWPSGKEYARDTPGPQRWI